MQKELYKRKRVRTKHAILGANLLMTYVLRFKAKGEELDTRSIWENT